MNRKRASRKGSYTLEAAIFLPVFLIGILTIGYFIKVVGTAEMAVHGITDELRLYSSIAYTEKTGIAVPDAVEERVRGDCEAVDSVLISQFKYLSKSGENDGIITIAVTYNIPVPIPLELHSGISRQERVMCRGWIGQKGRDGPMGFSEMEKEGSSKTVWVFPRHGEKYHKKECTYVSNLPVQALLGRNIKNKYSPCKHCNAKDIQEGSLVYCFQKYGETYHKANCKHVKKYIVPMEEEDAKKKGYTPCSKCGG